MLEVTLIVFKTNFKRMKNMAHIDSVNTNTFQNKI